MNKYLQEREELKNFYEAPENRRLKYCAIALIALVIILLLSMTIWIDEISTTGILIMRGCAGLGATAFIIIVGILSYRVNKQHISNRKNKKILINLSPPIMNYWVLMKQKIKYSTRY